MSARQPKLELVARVSDPRYPLPDYAWFSLCILGCVVIEGNLRLREQEAAESGASKQGFIGGSPPGGWTYGCWLEGAV
jgi:hypothetical protein